MINVEKFPEYYQNTFSVVRANTQILLNRVYQLRYQVYCLENKFEDPAEHLDGREMDRHDARSAHLLLLHRKSGMAVGTARLIMPDIWDSLPIWHVLEPEVREQFERLPLHRTGEVSRFAVSKEFRRWWQHHRDPATASAPQHARSDEQRFMQYITFGLIHDLLQIAIERGLHYVTAVMNPSLLRIVTNLGVEFKPIGAPVEYHGIRQPCVARVSRLIEQLQKNFTLLWQFCSSPGNIFSPSVRMNQ